MPFLLVALFAVFPVSADLADFVLFPLPFSLYPERMLPLLQEGPACEWAFHLEYADLYDYRNKKEKVSDGSYGPVEEKAAGFRASVGAFSRFKFLRAGITGSAGDFTGTINKGASGEEQYGLDRSGNTFLAHGAVVFGPAVLGGGTDPDKRHRYFFLRGRWKMLTGLYAFEADREKFSAILRPASLAKALEFDVIKKAGHYEGGLRLPFARLSLFYGPISLLNDSSLQSRSQMSSLLFFSGDKAGFSVDSTALPFKPRLYYRVLEMSGFYQGFFNRIRFGALEDVRLHMRQMGGETRLPLDIRAGCSYRKITASGTEGYLEASPFNAWNFFTHTFYKLRDPGLWCVEKSVYAARTFRPKTIRLEADLLAAYDVIEFDSRFIYKEREYMTLFGPIGWPYYGPEKEMLLAEGSEDFIYFSARLSHAFGRTAFSLSGSQYVPVPEMKKGGGAAGPSQETVPDILGGSDLRFSVLFSL